MSSDGLRRAMDRLFPLLALALAALFAARCATNIRAGAFGLDFRGTLWEAGKAVLDGRSPYPAAKMEALRQAGNPAVYPPLTLVLAAPLSTLPLWAATALWDIIAVAALVLAMHLCGLRDWRGYVILLLSLPVAISLVLGQLDCLLALACAVAWRWRDRSGFAAGAAVGLGISAKLLLWPLVFWLVATRRWRAAATACCTAVATTAAAWAVLGFDGLRTYPQLLSATTHAFEERGSSLTALAVALGADARTGRAVSLVAAAVLLGASVLLGRRGDDRRSFALAVGAGILGSPIVWLHYLVVLYVPFVLAHRAVTAVWIVPALSWLALTENPSGTPLLLVNVTVVLALFAATLGPGGRRPGADAAAAGQSLPGHVS